MKSTLKLALIVVLFSATTFAEGDMGNGGRTCPNGTTTCLVAGEPTQNEKTDDQSDDSILVLIQEYFDAMTEYFKN